MSRAVSSTSLREKGDMLLSGATADQEKRTPGRWGQVCIRKASQALAPWCLEGLSGSAGPAGQKGSGMSPQQFPISSCQPPLWLPHGPRASYLRKINECGRSRVCLWRFVVLPNIELVAVLLEERRVWAVSVEVVWDRRACTLHFGLIWSGMAPLVDKQLEDK